MRPAAIDVARIARDPAVKAYVVDKNRLALTALLRNGDSIRLAHGGCAHSGAAASLWLDATLPLDAPEAWTKQIARLARIAFTPDIANDIVTSVQSGAAETTTTESDVTISASPSSFMRYTIVIASTEQGVLLTITYALG